MSLFKIKDGTERTPIRNANGQIEITLTIPDTIYAPDKTYSIIRVHDGTAENIGGTYDRTNRTLTFKTNRFSTYAIAYTTSSVTPTITVHAVYSVNTNHGRHNACFTVRACCNSDRYGNCNKNGR